MIPDPVWQVITDYLLHYEGLDTTDEHRAILERESAVHEFDGGCFLSRGSELDLFVIPEKRGKWRIRSEVTKFLETMHRDYDRLTARVYPGNLESLRLVKHFGFKECGLENGLITLERFKNGRLGR